MQQVLFLMVVFVSITCIVHGQKEFDIVDSEVQRTQYRQMVLELLSGEQFDKIEEIAKDARRAKVYDEDGFEVLDNFYRTFMFFTDYAEKNKWEEMLSAGKKWRKRYPHSITALTACGLMWMSYAWKGRTDQLAKDVKDEQWRSFGERLGKASEYLKAGTVIEEKCPGWYTAVLKLYLALGITGEDYEMIYKRGTERYPTYSPLYQSKAFHLLPRWYGTGNEWAAFAKELIGKQELDEEMYARILLYIQMARLHPNIYTQFDLDWNAAKKGFTALIQKFPHSVFLKSWFCWHACLNGDKQTVREMFDELGNTVDLAVWGSLQKYKEVKTWAYE